MSDCGGDHGALAYSHDVHTSHDYSSHSHAHDHSPHTRHHNHSSSSNALPTYEDAVGSFHQYRASRNPGRHCTSAADRQIFPHCPEGGSKDNCNRDHQHHPHQRTSDHNTFSEVYDQQNIFDSPSRSRSAESRDQSKSSSAVVALKSRQVAGSERKSTHMSKCTICLIASFIIIVVSILLVLTLVRW